MKKYGCFFFVLLYMHSGLAQVLMNKDSLLKLLPGAKQDTNLVQLYINIGQQYEMNDHETAKVYYRKAGDLSEKLGYDAGIIKFISNYTYLLNVQKKTDSSLMLNKRALSLALQLKDPVIIGKTYSNTGSSFLHMDVYDSAIAYFEKGRQAMEEAGDEAMLARMADIMQNAYHELGQYDKAIQLSEDALNYYRTTNDSVTLGIILSNLGNNYVSKGDMNKGLAIYREGLDIARKIDYAELKQTLLLNIGNIYMQQQVVDSMKPYFDASLKIAEEMGIPVGESISLRGLAVHAMYKRNFTGAKVYIEKALALDMQYNSRAERISNLETLSSIQYTMHDIEQAERSLQQASKLRDSVNGDELKRQVLVIEKKFETQKKENQIKLQQAVIRQKNILNYILAGSAIGLIIIAGLGYRNYIQKQKLQQQRITELETEKKLAATEAVLKGEEQERTRLAKDLHDGLGGMLSGIKYSFQTMKGNLIMTPENQQAFERSIDMLDSSIKEMRRVAHNMMPEALLKFGLDTALKDFCNDINQSGVLRITYQSNGLENAVIDQTTAITIYRIVQELVNNTIKHAGASSAIVQVDKSENGITLTVEDDGKGFDTNILEYKGGIGWSNIQSRIDYLKGRLDVKSQPGKGTSVLVELNVKS
ncbi:MAG: sensor histidine kinase [Agriterribacter sp.]